MSAASAPTPDLRDRWAIDPAVEFLNHGSFGACPRAVLEKQAELRARMERQPVGFFMRELIGLLDQARAEVAAFVGADADDLAFVTNATAAVNTVLRSLVFAPGDELLTTQHEYNASTNALRYAAERSGAAVVIAEVPFPVASPDQVFEAVIAAVTPRTRLALVDHVTSPTGLVFPLARIVAELDRRGVDTLVDGAHGPGMVDLDLRAIGAAYYAGHGHKWLCAPKGAAFLVVRGDRHDRIRPLRISHGASAPEGARSRFRWEHDTSGTEDPTPFLCLPEAIRHLGSLVPGGWPEVRRRNHELALHAQGVLCGALGIPRPAPPEMIGSMATVPIPDGAGQRDHLTLDPLQDAILAKHGIEVPVFGWPRRPKRVLRVSAQLYNRRESYERLAAALPGLLGR